MMESEANTSYSIGQSRYVSIDEDNEIAICDDLKGKRAFFTGPRWARFVDEIPNVDKAIIRAMKLKPTHFRCHVGGNWHVSVTDEVPFVDLRRWYVNKLDNSLRPTPVGLALTYTQWNNVKEVVELIKKDHPELANTSPCWHNSQRCLHACAECTPNPSY